MSTQVAPRQAVEPTDPWPTGLDCSVGLARRRRVPRAAPPLVLDRALDVDSALARLRSTGQGIAFVAAHGIQTGVVTADDLAFAREWAGPRATVAQATTQALVDVTDHTPLT